MNCAEVNQIDMVDYLYSLGYQPQRIKNNDYWYLSPLRAETHASFKVNKAKNAWYDHGIGEGGNLIDFTVKYIRCNTSEALQKLSSFQPQNTVKTNVERAPFHLPENVALESTETAIK